MRQWVAQMLGMKLGCLALAVRASTNAMKGPCVAAPGAISFVEITSHGKTTFRRNYRLRKAARAGDVSLLRELITAGADVNHSDMFSVRRT